MAVDFVKTAAMIILFGFLWRLLSLKLAGTRAGAATAFIY